MTNVKILFDNNEYFRFTSANGSWGVENNLAFKEANVSAIPNVQIHDFIKDMKAKGNMLARMFIDDKLFIESFVNSDNFQYRDTASGGTEIDIQLSDRFTGLKNSDIIKTKPVGNLQNFISSMLTELDYSSPSRINTYDRKIKKTDDFIVNGEGVVSQKIKSFARHDIVEKDAKSLLGEALALSNLLLVSNGYDTLSLEKTNSYPSPIFTLLRTDKACNIKTMEKVGGNSEPTPSQIVILNSSGVKEEGSKKIKKDQNSSVIVNYKAGIPHIKKVKHISASASYQDIKKSIDFHFAGIKAAENSFIYRVSNSVFDSNGNFFRPNRLIRLIDHKYLIDEDMQILRFSFNIDPTSTEISLNLTTQNSFDNNASLNSNKKK